MNGSDQVTALVATVLGTGRACATIAHLAPMLPADGDQVGEAVTRAHFAQALNIVLFADVIDRVPSGAAYVERVTGKGANNTGHICLDHGALRTILMPQGGTGALPAGRLAFDRILAPLGYTAAATYPLPRLAMTGYAYAHTEHPETLPQFFVSELHVDRFDEGFAEACARVFGASVDPLDASARAVLAHFAAGDNAAWAEALAALPVIAAAFDRHHPIPTLADYEILKAASAEAAWLATEGNAFNHATDRVEDVEALAEALRTCGAPIKDRVEISASGRVRQTAFRAAAVTRPFIAADGQTISREVPGSFFEFITRAVDPATGTLDLAFDSSNATGIFAMTRVA